MTTNQTDGGIPEFLKVANREPLTAEQQSKLVEVRARARAPHRAQQDLRQRQKTVAKEKSRVRIERLKAKQSGDAAKMPLSGRAALAAILK